MRSHKTQPTSNKSIGYVIAVMLLPFAGVFAEIQAGADTAAFYQSLENDDENKALEIGRSVFQTIEDKYRADQGFNTFKSKLAAAEFLANQMIGQLQKATNRQMFGVAGEVFENKASSQNRDLISVAPAKSFYDMSLEIFVKPVQIGDCQGDEKRFMARYYDLKLRVLTARIAEAGQALAIAEPSFTRTHDYVLVLPLLHVAHDKLVNMDILPPWMQSSDQLDIFSDSCLMHFGLAFQAQAFAGYSARLHGRDFSKEDFYKNAAKQCSKQSPRVAVDCLNYAIEAIDKERTDEIVDMRFEIVQVWQDSDDYMLAAGEAKEIADRYPKHKRYADAIWLHYYALSRANKPDLILNSIDSAVGDPRCSDYTSKLMFVQWWALRAQRDQTAHVAALEHRILKEYADDPMTAPILLSQGTDLLAQQDYSGASLVLEQLQEKFPASKAAEQAKKILERLKTLK